MGPSGGVLASVSKETGPQRRARVGLDVPYHSVESQTLSRLLLVQRRRCRRNVPLTPISGARDPLGRLVQDTRSDGTSGTGVYGCVCPPRTVLETCTHPTQPHRRHGDHGGTNHDCLLGSDTERRTGRTGRREPPVTTGIRVASGRPRSPLSTPSLQRTWGPDRT